MTQAPETHPSVTVHTPARLALYDLFILGLSCSLVWRCPKRHFLDLYDQHVSSPHLDIGVGTGYFLDRCRFSIEHPQITLLDPSDACLRKAARRLEPYSPRVVKASALEPLERGAVRFASVALNGVLHCLPATPKTKAAVFHNLKPFLADDGVVFGSTILVSAVEHSRLARKAPRPLQPGGILHEPRRRPRRARARTGGQLRRTAHRGPRIVRALRRPRLTQRIRMRPPPSVPVPLTSRAASAEKRPHFGAFRSSGGTIWTH